MAVEQETIFNFDFSANLVASGCFTLCDCVRETEREREGERLLEAYRVAAIPWAIET